MRRLRSDAARSSTRAGQTRALLPRELLVLARPDRRRPARRGLPAFGASRPRALRGHGPAVHQSARPAAGCRLRRRPFSADDAPARLPRHRAGFFSASGGGGVAAAGRSGGLRHAGAGTLSSVEPGRLDHVSRAGASLRSARLPDGCTRLAGSGRAAGSAGAQCRLLAIPPPRAAPGTAWMCRGTCSIFAPRIWSGCWSPAASKWCAASISPCATIPRGWPAAWPRASIRWRAVSASARKARGARIAKDLAYLALALAAAPFTVAEAACRAGSTIMIEARRP